MDEISRITRLRLTNFKSIRHCDLAMERLTVLVGPNGSGKSNLLDSLSFVSDALTNGLDHAVRQRGSIADVITRGETQMTVECLFRLNQSTARYLVQISDDAGTAVVDKEVVEGGPGSFLREHNAAAWGSPNDPAIVPIILPDRLALVNFASMSEFRPSFDFLRGFRSYNFVPNEMRILRPASPEPALDSTGGNVANVLRAMDTNTRLAVNSTMERIVSGLKKVEPKAFGSYEGLEFSQRHRGTPLWRFRANSMSDGTLRALGILVAINQSTTSGPLVIGIEEPETAIHPGALKVLLHAIREAAKTRQIIVTSHSADLLDDPDLPPETILVTEMVGGETKIGPMDDASRQAVKDALFTPGELLRQGQLERAAD
jgi:predicted ATPase